MPCSPPSACWHRNKQHNVLASSTTENNTTTECENMSRTTGPRWRPYFLLRSAPGGVYPLLCLWVLVGNSWRIVIGGWSLTKVCHVCLLRSQSDGYPAGSLTPDLPDGLEMIDRWTLRWVLTEFWTNKLLSCPVRSCRKC